MLSLKIRIATYVFSNSLDFQLQLEYKILKYLYQSICSTGIPCAIFDSGSFSGVFPIIFKKEVITWQQVQLNGLTIQKVSGL